MIHNALSFVAVVKAGSFSNAAKILRVSKAQLSRHVSQLESTLGIQLLHRTTRSMTLTESGEQFFLSCRDLEETYEEAISALKDTFEAMRGTLRITAPISFGSEFLPQLVYEFTQRYPNIKIILSLSSTTEDLIDKKFDLAFRIAPQLPSSTLRMRTVMELEMVLCASPTLFQHCDQPKILDDLKNFRCVTSVNRNSETTKIYWACHHQQKKVKFAPNSMIEVDSLRAQIQLLLLGAGIGRVPKIFVEKELQAGKLIAILPALKQPSNSVYLLYPNKKVLPKKILAFIELAAQFFRPAI
jgi:DNA-binding transcriptional LysR family regulator